jgi:hypothetical protein
MACEGTGAPDGVHHATGCADRTRIALQQAGELKEVITAHCDAAAIFRKLGYLPGEAFALSHLRKTRAGL